ncbi:type I restriction endonuclease subunit R [Ktedonobacter robiniae]|uniref:Type I restriction enzyme endonuclease subunit n=1 Tax=Ktedonobacter robiniae TaxID=2778365 RepID=A0ABQ3UTQ2_9CHLR|nr:type I restriction endonuclease subunit R [Ktedonobacter robiniae]GHO56071.1 DEAD/DEAH box helicase [Ktedonobacter robiniae]
MYEYNELNRIEKPAIDLFTQLGYTPKNAYYDKAGPYSALGRQHESEVVLVKYLRPALEELNKDILSPIAEQAEDLIGQAIEEIRKDRSDRSLAEANREVYQLLKEGVKIPLAGENKRDETQSITLRYIDWEEAGNNNYLLVSQLWIRHDIYNRRTDLLGFVNGIPLIFVEFKAIHERLEHAYNNNLKDYKTYIPQLFWYNAFIILSNGRESRIGSLTAGWEHFSTWTRIEREDEPPRASLETIIRGTCQPKRLLDMVENFTLFSDESGGVKKIIARNHQYLGVNNAIEILKHRKEYDDKLGVFWHTQGSGKSYSMVFFVQKVHYKLKGDWTFLIVTDREDLDKQIYQTFKNANVVKGNETHARGGKHLQQLLKENHRVIFTTIQKFHLRKLNEGEKTKKEAKPKKPAKKERKKYPALTDRSNIIVISDEAHRSQYADLSQNMREALPYAAFIGFTGTPLIEGEEREETRKKFGDYISKYNFGHSIEDGTTVPLFYENRSPEIQVINSEINTQISEVLAEAEAEEEEEEGVQKKFKELYNIITLEPRLETIAEDIAQHFMRRGYRGKAMVVSIDKMTAVKMYNKVQKYWRIEIDKLKAQLQATDENDETQEDLRAKLQHDINYMEATDMAVVVSSEQNEDEKFKKKGLDIQTHRRRMETEDLEGMFKSPIHNLRIVFVCAMWMTGFDVPSLSTVYLDKPMRNHTLMQTIARANRVFRNRENGLKVNGLIVDYLGIFNDIRKALAIYASNRDKNTDPADKGDMPIRNKRVLLPYLQGAVREVEEFCQKQDIDLPAILATSTMDSIHLLADATNKIVKNDQTQKQYVSLAASAERYYNAMLPNREIRETYEKRVALVVEIARILYSLKEPTDVSSIMENINNLMSESVTTKDYVVRKVDESTSQYILPERIDLSKIDYQALAEDFNAGNQAIKYDRLRGKVAGKVQYMLRRNKKRVNYQEEFQRMIDEYNQGSANQEIHYYKLLQFMKKLGEEDERHVKEGLTEEELALYDIVLLPDIKLTEDEKDRIKIIVRKLLATLKNEKLRSDWNTKQAVKAQVRNAIKASLTEMPNPYLQELNMLGVKIYEHIASTYDGMGKSIYDEAS